MVLEWDIEISASILKEMHDTEISHSVLTEITDWIIPDIKQWRSRKLDAMYCILWLDAMHFKVREDGKVVHKILYNILGIDKDGRKQILGMYISESERATYSLSSKFLMNSYNININLRFILIFRPS